MGFLVFAVLLGVPALEIAVFIEVGGVLGVWWTLALIVATAAAGSALLRAQGLATLARVQASLDRNEAPVADLFDGLCVLVAGVLLLTPGFVTDAVGLVLFIPPVRWLLMGWAWQALARRGGFGGWTRRWGTGDGVIDAEYRVVQPGPREGGDADKDDRPRLGGQDR